MAEFPCTAPPRRLVPSSNFQLFIEFYRIFHILLFSFRTFRAAVVRPDDSRAPRRFPRLKNEGRRRASPAYPFDAKNPRRQTRDQTRVRRTAEKPRYGRVCRHSGVGADRRERVRRNPFLRLLPFVGVPAHRRVMKRRLSFTRIRKWIPAFAGMTIKSEGQNHYPALGGAH